MHTELPPAEWVRRQFGLPEPTQQPEPTKPKKPRAPHVLTDAERHQMAVKAVELARGGLTSYAALKAVKLTPYYGAAIRECLAGCGPITDAVRSGDLRTIPANIGNGQASFVRWFYDLPKIRGQITPDNENLRAALIATGMNACAISREVGLHETTVRHFMTTRQSGMFRKNRERCWAWLETLKK
jgi:hypothetical protein